MLYEDTQEHPPKVYDIFEIMPDGVPVWKCAVTGQDAALKELESLAMTCENEIRVVHLSTQAVFASKPPMQKRAKAAEWPKWAGPDRHAR